MADLNPEPQNTPAAAPDPVPADNNAEVATSVQTGRRFEDLPPAAQRALREAEARRAAIDAHQQNLPKEIDGRGGLEPTRYDDWEIKGLTADF